MKKLLIGLLLALSACSWSGSLEKGQSVEYYGHKLTVVEKVHVLENYSYLIMVEGIPKAFIAIEYSDGTRKFIPVEQNDE